MIESLSSSIQSNIIKGDAAMKASEYYAALNFYLDAAFYIVKQNWKLPVRQKIRSIITADINGDGNDEVLFGTEGHSLFAYSSFSNRKNEEPFQIWGKPFVTNDWVTGIAAADINDDGTLEIIVASDMLYILNADGQKIKEFPSKYPLSALHLFSDLNGKEMIVVGDAGGNIICYRFDLTEIWAIPFKKSNSRIIDLAVGDFDGDGRIEVAAASEDKFVYIIDDTGNEKDRIDVNHWIVNMADCQMRNNKLRLFIGKFTGDTLVYKHKQTSQAVALEQSGILDLKVEYVFNIDEHPQFIVGSSDRCLTIFNYNGDPIWIIETGLGQRALSLKKTGDGKFNLFVGTESGEVFCYSVRLIKELVSKIESAYHNIGINDLLDLKLTNDKLRILRNYIKYNPINQDASLVKAQAFSNSDFNKAIVSAMEVWLNNCEFVWAFPTGGRIYDLAPFISGKSRGLLVGSDDGTLYCLNQNGVQEWVFNSRRGMRGNKQGIRGVCYDKNTENIYTASVDKSLYCLNHVGKPQWNFCHEDWMLFTETGCFKDKDCKYVFTGTEDGYVLAFDIDGQLRWKTQTPLEERVRALAFCDDYYGESYLLVGCDDNQVYVIDSNGAITNSFSTPHYVLVIQVTDIDGDGQVEILTGNEDGHLHVYDFLGNFLWRFETESWIAALDVFYNNETNETEIVIGSQDNHIYALNKYGALLWQYETNARVRTLSADSVLNRVAFGSYDKSAYMLKQVNRENLNAFLQKLFTDSIMTFANEQERTRRLERLINDESRHKRAFAFLFVNDIDILVRGIQDTSEIVKASVGSNLVENFLPYNRGADILTELLVESSRRVKAIILTKMNQMVHEGKIKIRMASKILSDVIKAIVLTSSRIDVFRYWLAMTDSCDDILRLADDLIPQGDTVSDEFLIDELNRACIVALKKSSADNGDYTILKIAEKLSTILKSQYPLTAQSLVEHFH